MEQGKTVCSGKTNQAFAIGREGLEADAKRENFVLPHVPFSIEQLDKNMVMLFPCLPPQGHFIALRPL